MNNAVSWLCQKNKVVPGSGGLQYRDKSGKTYSSGVTLTESDETARKVNMIIGQWKHCCRNDHWRKSRAFCPFFEGKLHSSIGTHMINDDQLPVVDTEPVNSTGLNYRANRANKMEVSNSCCPIILYMWKRALTMEFFVQEIIRLNIASQDYHSDDDVLANSDSDSDILETVEKADSVEFLEDDSSTLVGFEEEWIT